MDSRAAKKYILSLKDVKLSHPYGPNLAVYTVQDEMFAIIEVGKEPLRISLRCDRRLMKVLLERYEEVMPGHKLNKNKWITVVLTGQLDKDDIEGLIYHSYTLVAEDVHH
jgi:predicted DNA-binding protein (MmcQ/YjbR family)